MALSFRAIAASPTTPQPAQLAVRIRWALIPFYATMPLGFIGIVLLIAGFVIRETRRAG